MITVRLTDKDREQGMKYARLRNDKKEAENYYTLFPSLGAEEKKSWRRHINYMGVLTEMSVSRVLGVPFQQFPDPLKGDEGIDHVMGDLKLQDKYNHYSFGDLYLSLYTELKADIYILVTGNDRELTLNGYATRGDFQTRSEVKNYGYGPNNAIPQNRLRNIDELLALGGS